MYLEIHTCIHVCMKPQLMEKIKEVTNLKENYEAFVLGFRRNNVIIVSKNK